MPFEAIFDEHFGYVTTVLGRLGVPKRDLADVAHDVFLQVFRNFDVYDASRPLRPWLFGIAYRAASNHRRKAHRRLELVDNSLVESSVELGIKSHPGPDEQLISAQEQVLFELALREVDLERRAILILHEIEGRRITETAKILALPLNTAYSRLRLARRDFETAVKRLRARGAFR